MCDRPLAYWLHVLLILSFPALTLCDKLSQAFLGSLQQKRLPRNSRTPWDPYFCPIHWLEITSSLASDAKTKITRSTSSTNRSSYHLLKVLKATSTPDLRGALGRVKSCTDTTVWTLLNNMAWDLMASNRCEQPNIKIRCFTGNMNASLCIALANRLEWYWGYLPLQVATKVPQW